jgi:hypothetical protein
MPYSQTGSSVEQMRVRDVTPFHCAITSGGAAVFVRMEADGGGQDHMGRTRETLQSNTTKSRKTILLGTYELLYRLHLQPLNDLFGHVMVMFAFVVVVHPFTRNKPGTRQTKITPKARSPGHG